MISSENIAYQKNRFANIHTLSGRLPQKEFRFRNSSLQQKMLLLYAHTTGI